MPECLCCAWAEGAAWLGPQPGTASTFSAEFTFCLVLMILLHIISCVRDQKGLLEPRLPIEFHLEEADATPGLE